MINKKNENVIDRSVVDVLEENYMPYSVYVILSRAIPAIDGFKPVHRRILFTMYKMKQFHDKRRTKSKDVVGQVMTLHPHGDGAIYDAMRRMAREDTFSIPFIDGKGDFGVNTSKEFVGSDARYTEARLSLFGEQLFVGIENNSVPMKKDYNDDKLEPVLLPTAFPNILVIPNMGIAVGMASNIPSFNFNEVCTALDKFIDDENINLLDYIYAPDFGTGGIILFDEQEMNKIYDTGRGKIKVRAKYRYNSTKNAIEILELPYTTTREVIMEDIVDLIRNGDIKGISNIKDLSDIKGFNLTIYLKKNANYKEIMKELFINTELEDTFSCNFNILLGDRPRVIGIKDIFREWMKFRIESIRSESKFKLDKLKVKQHHLEGIKSILVDIDKAIEIIRKTKKKADVVKNLKDYFHIDDEQAISVTKIQLGNLNEERLLEMINSITAIKKEMERLNDLIEKDECVKMEIQKQLRELNEKFPCPRRSEICKTYIDYKKDKKQKEKEKSVEIKDYDVNVYVTKEGYIKKVPVTSINASTGFTMKEGDELTKVFHVSNKDSVLVFTNTGNTHILKLNNLEDSKMSNIGEYIYNLIKLDEDEKIVDVVAVDFEDESYKILLFYKDGRCNKINLDAYDSRYSLLKGNIKGDELIFAEKICENNSGEYLLITEKGRALIIDSFGIKKTKNRKALGIKGIKLKEDDQLKKVIPLPLHDSKLKIKTINKGIVEVELLYNFFKGEVGNYGIPLYTDDDIIDVF